MTTPPRTRSHGGHGHSSAGAGASIRDPRTLLAAVVVPLVFALALATFAWRTSARPATATWRDARLGGVAEIEPALHAADFARLGQADFVALSH